MQKREFSLSLQTTPSVDGRPTTESGLTARKISAIFTDMADQANGSVLMRLGDTTVLVTAVMSPHKKEGTNFFPLTVEYEERFYASGQILGGQYMRREGKPSEEATLSARAIDRTIRPLFNQKIRNEIQVVITTLSIDNENDPDILGVIGASLALSVSDIPWDGPVSAVRICANKETVSDTVSNSNQWVVNPTHTERENTPLEMLVCAKGGSVNMIEAGSHEASEADIEEALRQALVVTAQLEAWQHEIVQAIGKPKTVVATETVSSEVAEFFVTEIQPRLDTAVFSGTSGKKAIEALKEEWVSSARKKFPEASYPTLGAHFDEAVGTCLHEGAVGENKRADGRAVDEVRPLYAQAGGFSSVVHGSGLFYRGGTHVLSVLTLGGPRDSLQLEGAEVTYRKHFMHHYNFAPFSAGETGKMGGPNRRMIGHGALVEKALRVTLPSREQFPYTIRVVSESLASNGSTSMAAVCASTLALMDGGVPITRPTAGISIGLMMEKSSKFQFPISKEIQDPKLQTTHYKLLTDIQGPEDEHGDMDFKVAGTREGITAIQMDVKVDGIPLAILEEAFAAAKKARLHVIDAIEAAIPSPRPELQLSAQHVSTNS